MSDFVVDIFTECAGCGEDIRSGQSLLALAKQWHLWCFTCTKCGCLLAGEYMARLVLKLNVGTLISEIMFNQGSYRSWKTWKVMELKYFSFQAWKVMEFNCRSWKVMENYSYVWYVNYCRSGSKDKINFRRVMSENTPNTRTILTIFETGS